MDWLREHYDRALLGAASLGLLVVATMLILRALGFPEEFSALQTPPTRSTAIPAVDLAQPAAAKERLNAKADWEGRRVDNGREIPLFVSVPYIAKVETRDGAPVETLIDPVRSTEMLHPPVPNVWLLKNRLPLLDPRVLTDDPDGDGFTNLDEFIGQTDPNAKDSHPPYPTKLFLKQFIQRPFRLVFSARVGETLQINTLDLDAPTQFLKVGDAIKGTKFRVVDFKPVEKVDVSVGIRRDVSEVTVENTETKERVILVKEQTVDSPDSFALLAYLWEPGREFSLKKGQEFSLNPEPNVKYRLVEFSAEGAVIVPVAKPDQRIALGKLPPAAAPRPPAPSPK